MQNWSAPSNVTGYRFVDWFIWNDICFNWLGLVNEIESKSLQLVSIASSVQISSNFQSFYKVEFLKNWKRQTEFCSLGL